MNKRLYEKDFFAWTQSQADALRRRSANELDWENLVEEVRDMGGRDRREVKSRVINLLVHLLKWRHQPERRSASWANSINVPQEELPLIFEQSPSLGAYADEVLADAYSHARRSAAKQTRLPIETFRNSRSILRKRCRPTSSGRRSIEAGYARSSTRKRNGKSSPSPAG